MPGLNPRRHLRPTHPRLIGEAIAWDILSTSTLPSTGQTLLLIVAVDSRGLTMEIKTRHAHTALLDALAVGLDDSHDDQKATPVALRLNGSQDGHPRTSSNLMVDR